MLFTVLSLLIGCAQAPVDSTHSSTDALPDEVMFALVVDNPELLISNLDGYLAEIPSLGEDCVKRMLFGTEGSLAEFGTNCGINADGSICIFMVNMMPQSIGGAFTVSSDSAFRSEVEYLMSIEESEPIGNTNVSVTTIPNTGQIFFCYKGGLVLFAGSRTQLEAMMNNLDGENPDFIPDISSAGVYYYIDMKSVGPMLAMQLGSYKSLILESMSNSEAEMNPQQMSNIVDLYIDFFHIILTETEYIDLTIAFGESDINGSASCMFIPGSTLDSIIIPVEPASLIQLIPAGDVAIAGVSLAEETSTVLMTAYCNAFGIVPVPGKMVEFWAACSRNTAITLLTPTTENPMHIIAVYELPEGAGLSEIKDAYDDQMQMSAGFLDSMDDMQMTDPEIQSYGGLDWVTFSMDFTAPDVSELSMYSGSGDFGWTAWLTIHENHMYMEMAEKPDVLLQIFSEGVEIPATLDGFDPDAEMALAVNISGYAEMIAATVGSGYVDTEFNPVWMNVEVDIVDGGVKKEFSLSGIELCRFIGEAMELFGDKR